MAEAVTFSFGDGQPPVRSTVDTKVPVTTTRARVAVRAVLAGASGMTILRTPGRYNVWVGEAGNGGGNAAWALRTATPDGAQWAPNNVGLRWKVLRAGSIVSVAVFTYADSGGQWFQISIFRVPSGQHDAQSSGLVSDTFLPEQAEPPGGWWERQLPNPIPVATDDELMVITRTWNTNLGTNAPANALVSGNPAVQVMARASAGSAGAPPTEMHSGLPQFNTMRWPYVDIGLRPASRARAVKKAAKRK